MDRNFSTIDKLLKETEVSSLDDLVQLIESTPLTPKPVCKNMFYIFDWKSFIADKFSKMTLENHSFYHSFQFCKENGTTKLRAKPYPQDTDFVPSSGLALIKSNISFIPVGPTEFRIDKLELDKVFRTLETYLSTMPLTKRIEVSATWYALRETLESLPTKSDELLKMNLFEFPQQSEDPDYQIPEHLAHVVECDGIPQIRGELVPVELSVGNFDEEISLDADVVVYTRSKSNRPWVGRVIRILECNKFTIQWYKRRNRGNTFYAMVNQDGSPVLAELSTQVVMYWHISENDTRTANSFQLSYYWLEKISQDYFAHDATYE